MIIEIRIMKNLFVACIMLSLYSCKKDKAGIAPETIESIATYTKHTILQGQHFSDKSSFKSFSGNKMDFKVKFDSSAIYQTVDPVNQFDINKLYGFSEGSDHHVNSARIGWAWNRNALRLYAYVYSGGIRKMKEITTAGIGPEISCSIGISGNQYLFSINEITLGLERAIEGPAIAGYGLYPYFGGDEVAPGNISIYIMDVKK